MRDTFGVALTVVWKLVLGVAIVGSLCSIGMKQLQLHTKIDEDWGREDMLVDHGWSHSASTLTKQTKSMSEARSV